MKNHHIVNVDTDSIMIVKNDQSPWTPEEESCFLKELNNQFPEKIRFEHDGVFDSVVVFKAKNYALLHRGEVEIKLKGSSIRDQKKEPALREMMEEIIKELCGNADMNTINAIYHRYVREALFVKDIKRWCQKKTITRAILDCENWTQEDIEKKKLRMNEVSVWEAIKHLDDLQEGNKVYVYPAVLDTRIEVTTTKTGKHKEKTIVVTGLKSETDWDLDHDSNKLLERVYDTLCIFENVLNMEKFINYSLKRNEKLLGDL